MPLEGDYAPSPWDWVREQVEEYESSNGERGNTLRDTGLPVVIITTRGRKSGKIRKFALMRVEHEGEYALVASLGGAPDNPTWYGNLVADPPAPRACVRRAGARPRPDRTRAPPRRRRAVARSPPRPAGGGPGAPHARAHHR